MGTPQPVAEAVPLMAVDMEPVSRQHAVSQLQVRAVRAGRSCHRGRGLGVLPSQPGYALHWTRIETLSQNKYCFRFTARNRRQAEEVCLTV